MIIIAEVKAETNDFGFNVKGLCIRYDSANSKIVCGDSTANVKPFEGKLKIRFLIDRTSVEVFINEGQVYMPLKAIPQNDFYKTIEFFAADKVRLTELKAYQLKSIWF